MRMPAVVVHQDSASDADVGQIAELLAGKEVLLDVLDDAFDPRLVGRGPDPGGVDDEASRLGVFHEGVVEPWRGILGDNDGWTSCCRG